MSSIQLPWQEHLEGVYSIYPPIIFVNHDFNNWNEIFCKNKNPDNSIIFRESVHFWQFLSSTYMFQEYQMLCNLYFMTICKLHAEHRNHLEIPLDISEWIEIRCRVPFNVNLNPNAEISSLHIIEGAAMFQQLLYCGINNPISINHQFNLIYHDERIRKYAIAYISAQNIIGDFTSQFFPILTYLSLNPPWDERISKFASPSDIFMLGLELIKNENYNSNLLEFDTFSNKICLGNSFSRFDLTDMHQELESGQLGSEGAQGFNPLFVLYPFMRISDYIIKEYGHDVFINPMDNIEILKENLCPPICVYTKGDKKFHYFSTSHSEKVPYWPLMVDDLISGARACIKDWFESDCIGKPNFRKYLNSVDSYKLSMAESCFEMQFLETAPLDNNDVDYFLKKFTDHLLTQFGFMYCFAKLPSIETEQWSVWASTELLFLESDFIFLPCPHNDCKYHSLKLCARYLSIPDSPDKCQFPSLFKRTYPLSLDDIKRKN